MNQAEYDRKFAMNWILLKSDEIEGGLARLTDARARHICKVLRAEPGKHLRVGLIDGPFGNATVLEVSPEQVLLDCSFESSPPLRPKIDLLLAMPRPKVLKRLWPQFAALGVGRILITNAEKVERYYFDTHILDSEFYTPRLIEGLQQAGDTWVPEVKVIRYLKPFLAEELDSLFPKAGKKLLADPSGQKTLFQTLETSTPSDDGRVLLAVGPEGGWTPYELDLFRSSGFELFGLGPRILRTDTACISLLGMLSALR